MMQWQNGFFGVSKAAVLGWAKALASAANAAPAKNSICPQGMRLIWKVAAFRLTGSIWILSGRRALRCFQIEQHHFVISILKWYKV